MKNEMLNGAGDEHPRQPVDEPPQPLMPPVTLQVTVPNNMVVTWKLALRLVNANLQKDGAPLMGMQDLMMMAMHNTCEKLIQEAAAAPRQEEA